MEYSVFKNKLRRSKNFTMEEITILIEEIGKRRDVLYMKGTGSIQVRRDEGWEQVLTAVNAVAPARRTTSELKKKFKDLKSRTRSKVKDLCRKNRRPMVVEKSVLPLTAVEERMLTFIGVERIKAEGRDSFREIVLNNGASPSTSSSFELDLQPPPCPLEPRLEVCPEFIAVDISQPPEIKLESDIDISPEIILEPTFGCSPSPTPPVSESKMTNRRKRRKTRQLGEIRQTTRHQAQTNRLLKQLVGLFNQFLLLKKREVDLMEENMNFKRRRTL